MPGYRTKTESVPIAGVADLRVISLLDSQQFHDPLGAAAALGISAASWPLFGQIWPSGLQLADRLADRPVRRGERILEIGCGLALASLVCHRRGADVTASDIHPQASRLLRANLRLNGLGPMRFHHGPWSRLPPPQAPAPTGFDLLIGSDLLYEPDRNGALAGFVAHHAAPAAELWLIDPDRGNRAFFHAQMRALGFARTEQRCDSAATGQRAAYKGRLMIYRRETADGPPVSAPHPPS